MAVIVEAGRVMVLRMVPGIFMVSNIGLKRETVLCAGDVSTKLVRVQGRHRTISTIWK